VAGDARGANTDESAHHNTPTKPAFTRITSRFTPSIPPRQRSSERTRKPQDNTTETDRTLPLDASAQAITESLQEPGEKCLGQVLASGALFPLAGTTLTQYRAGTKSGRHQLFHGFRRARKDGPQPAPPTTQRFQSVVAKAQTRLQGGGGGGGGARGWGESFRDTGDRESLLSHAGVLRESNNEPCLLLVR